jgi:hypothetical protein
MFGQRLERSIHMWRSSRRLCFRAGKPGNGGRVGTLFLEESRQWGKERDNQKKNWLWEGLAVGGEIGRGALFRNASPVT